MTAAGIDDCRRRPRWTSPRSLRQEGLRGGLVYHDGVEDDARFTLGRGSDRDGRRRASRSPGSAPPAFGRTRAAACSTRCSPRTCPTGAELEIRTKAVVDATGVWAAEADHPLGSGATTGSCPAAGPISSCRATRIPNKAGLTIRVPGKIVFLVPWPDHWLIGTTDAPFDGPAEHPAAGGWEIQHLLDTVNATMDVGPDPGRRRRHLRGPAAAHRSVEWFDRQGFARASGHGRVERGRPHRAAASTRPIGSWRATSSMPSWAAGRRRDPAGPSDWRLIGAADADARAQHRRGTHDDPRDGRPRGRRGGPARRPARDGGVGRRRPGRGPRAAASARRRTGSSSKPRSPGPSATSRRCRSMTRWLAGPGSAQELPDRGEAIAPRVAAIMGADLGLGRDPPGSRGRARTLRRPDASSRWTRRRAP